VKLVDTNVLVYAIDESAPHHQASRHWLNGALSGAAPVGFTWNSLIAFVRLSTHPTIATRPLGVGDAMDVVDTWLGARSARVLQPGPRHASILRQMLSSGVGGNLTNDAHLAAIAVEHKATVVTFDSDFGRFDGVRWERPR